MTQHCQDWWLPWGYTTIIYVTIIYVVYIYNYIFTIPSNLFIITARHNSVRVDDYHGCVHNYNICIYITTFLLWRHCVYYHSTTQHCQGWWLPWVFTTVSNPHSQVASCSNCTRFTQKAVTSLSIWFKLFIGKF